jgi:pseudouridine synthase
VAKVRLQKLLAQAGIASRRRAEDMIRAGEVKVGGQVVTELGLQVDPHDDRVEVRGRRVRPEAPQYRVLLKPRGCLATLAAPLPDEDGEREKPPAKERGKAREKERGTLAKFIPDVEVGWQVVAPLDFLAEGVVLLTTDGALSARLSRGGGHVPMTYHLKFQGKVGDDEVARLLRGWRWDGRPVKPTRVEAIATTGKNTWVEMIVAESRPRVLKAAGETIRHTVLKISRVRLGEISFEGLKMGGFRELTKKEIKSLLHDAGLAAS